MLNHKDFYESYNRFSAWKKENSEHAVCYFQIVDLKNGVQVEKWKLMYSDKTPEHDIFLVEIYPHGNGFQLYKMYDPFVS